MPDTVEELNDLISKLTFLKKNFPDEEERQRRQQQFYGRVGGMEVDINSFESIEDAITSAEELKLKKEKEQEENGRETNFRKMLESQDKRIIIKKRPSHANKFKPIDGAKLAEKIKKRNRKDSNSSSDEELMSFTPTKKRKGGGRRTRGKKRTRKRRKSRRRKRRKSRRRKNRKKRTKRRR